MAETGDLIIKIGGDASKFKATIADVENSLKSFKANLGTTGLNIKIEALGFEEAKSNIKAVTEYAEGTLGSIQNRIKLIKKERLTVTADARPAITLVAASTCFISNIAVVFAASAASLNRSTPSSVIVNVAAVAAEFVTTMFVTTVVVADGTV